MEQAVEWKKKGNDHFRAKEYHKAIECYSKAIEINPNDHVYYSNRSGSYAGLGQYEEALKDAEKALEVKPDYATGFSRKGYAQLNLGLIDESIATYDEGLKQFPDNAKLINGKQSAEEKKGGAGMPDKNMQQQFLMKLLQNPETAPLFQKPDFLQKIQEIQTNPQNLMKYMADPDIQKAIGVLSGGMGGMGAGMGGGMGGMGGQNMPNFNSESTGNPMQDSTETPDFAPKFTTTEEKKEEPKMEEEVTEEDKNIKQAAEEKQKGTDLYKTGDIDGALAQYKKASELAPFNLLYRSNIVACLTMKKEYDEAIEACVEAVKTYRESDYSYRQPPHLAKIYSRHARILELQGKFDEALETYDKALLEHNDPKIKKAFKDLKKKKVRLEKEAYINPEIAETERLAGNDFFKEGKFADALKKYEEAIRRNPKDPKIHNNKATCYVKLLEFNLAMKSAEDAIKLDPGYVRAWVRKGSVHHFLKEYHKAIEAYQKALSLDKDNQQALQGIAKTQMAIQTGMNQGNDEERLKRAMADPEIQTIMMDPMIKIALGQMQQNPQAAQEYFNDPSMGPKLQKLIAAGVIKVG